MEKSWPRFEAFFCRQANFAPLRHGVVAATKMVQKIASSGSRCRERMPDPGLNSPPALARFLGANASSRRLRHRPLQEEGDFFQSPVLVAGPLLPSPPSSSPGPAPSWGRSWPLAELQPPPPLRGALRGQRKYEFRAWLPSTFGAQSAHVLMKPTQWGQVASTHTHTHTRGAGGRLQPRSRVAKGYLRRSPRSDRLGHQVNLCAQHPRAPPPLA